MSEKLKLFRFERYSIGDFLGMPCKGFFKERRVLDEKRMESELGFHPAYLAQLDSEEGPNELGEWVKVWRINHLAVAK